MDKTLIIILAIILFVLILLNHITIVTTSKSYNEGNCSQTAFGCCPDGVNSKINFYGTNCPKYNAGPGYAPVPVPVPVPVPLPPPYQNPPPNPNLRPNPPPPNPSPIVPGPGPAPPKPIGGCAGTRYGCCSNNVTPKINSQGANCN